MKKRIFAVAMTLCRFAGTSAFAQDRRAPRTKERPTAEQMAQRKTDRMVEKLNLNEDQSKQLYELNLQEVKDMQAQHERMRAARKAQAAYAAQPEWVRLRDSYADAAGDDEYAGKDLRIAVVRAMLADGQGAAAEDFFFAHCQGKVGDADCAMLIAGHYKAKKDAVALDAFVGKVSLRYDSDTQKVKSLTK